MSDTTPNPLVDAEAEQAVLGALMLASDEPEVVHTVRQLLPAPDHFHGGQYRLLYRVFCELIDKGVKLDPLTVRDHLRAQHLLDEVGGIEAIATLADAVPTAANAEFHAKIVRELADRRRMVAQGDRLRSLAHDRQLKTGDIMATVVHELATTSLHRVNRPIRTWVSILLDASEAIEQRLKSQRLHEGILTGLTDLDRITDGAMPGEAIIVGARPSLGKTALATRMARSAAKQFYVETPKDEDPPCAVIVSREMLIDPIVQRLFSAESDVPIKLRLKSGHWQDSDFTKMAKAQGTLSKLPLRILDTAGYDLSTPGQIRLALEHFQVMEKCRVGFVVVDYLQLLKADANDTHENRNLELGAVTQALKDIGMQMHVPMVILAQLNRELEKANRRPRGSDIRDSGEVEQIADKILLLHSEEKWNQEWPQGKIEVIVDKNRNGETGHCYLDFNKYTQRWRGWTEATGEAAA